MATQNSSAITNNLTTARIIPFPGVSKKQELIAARDLRVAETQRSIQVEAAERGRRVSLEMSHRMAELIESISENLLRGTKDGCRD